MIFHEAQANWTLSLFEAFNYGYFLGDVKIAAKIAKRIVDEAERLKVKEVVLTECGHAYIVMQYLYEGWTGKKHPFVVKSVLEMIAGYIDEGSIKLDSK